MTYAQDNDVHPLRVLRVVRFQSADDAVISHAGFVVEKEMTVYPLCSNWNDPMAVATVSVVAAGEETRTHSSIDITCNDRICLYRLLNPSEMALLAFEIVPWA